MVRPLVIIICMIVVLALPGTASAHSGYAGATGFTGGLLHPLFVPAHILAVAALGLLIGQQAPRWGCAVPVVYVIAIIAGLGAIALAVVAMLAENTLLGLAAVTGLLVALARPLRRSIGWLLGGAVGLSLGLDSPPDAIPLTQAYVTMLGTALGAAIILLALVQVASRLRRDWQRIGMRIFGSWLAASAILMLALRLTR